MSQLDLVGAFCNPKPVQRPHPPIVIGGRSMATLRVVAQHADVWNIPGGDIDDVVSRSATLDRFCAEIGRDPAAITRSIALPVSYDEPGTTRAAVAAATGAGLRHVVLIVPSPYPAHVARWLTDEIVTPSWSGQHRLGRPAGRPATASPDPAKGYRLCLQPPELFAVPCHCCTICDSEAAISVSRSLVAC